MFSGLQKTTSAGGFPRGRDQPARIYRPGRSRSVSARLIRSCTRRAANRSMFVAVLPVVTSPPIRNVHFQMPGSTFRTEYSIPRCSNIAISLRINRDPAWHGALAASIQNGADRRLVCPGKFSPAMWVGRCRACRQAHGVAHAALAALMIVGVGLPAHFRIQLSPCWKF